MDTEELTYEEGPIRVRTRSDWSGQCRSVNCTNLGCIDRRRHFVEIWVRGVRFVTDVPDVKTARELVRTTAIALGIGK